MRPARLRERSLLLLVIWTVVPVAEARADWLLSPFVGTTFGAKTALLQLDVGAPTSKHAIFGGSGGWLSDHVFGMEADLAFSPAFFEQDDRLAIVLKGRVTTLFGNAMAAVPISVSRDSLRPYVTGGLGLVRVTQEDIFRLGETDSSLGLQLGGGAVGMISNRAGVRFDLRHTRTLRQGATILGERQTKLSFWRATIGVVVRYD